MKKVTDKSNNSRLYKKRKTQVTKSKVTTKPVIKVTQKRLSNLKRRISNFLAERDSWEAKNKQLSNALKDEKLANAALQKELFECRKLNHENIVSLNSLKMKQQDIRRTVAAYQVENNPFPHLVALSSWLTTNKLRIDKLNTLLSSGDQGVSPKQNGDSSMAYYNKKNNKLTEPVGRVGPRVKGLLISKPQIMLERVMLPRTNDPDPDSQEAIVDTSTEEHTVPLSPIEEEQQDEEIPLRQISYRKKKTSRLGKSARRDKSSVDSHDSHIPFDMSNSSVNSSPIINRMEPVARLRDVSRLLHNSSLMQVDSAQLENGENTNTFQEAEGTRFSSSRNCRGQKPLDDPLEGCSWMTGQNYGSSMRNSRFAHVPLPSDSSDDDDLDCLPTKKHITSYNSPLPNPLMNSTANSNCRIHDASKDAGSNLLSVTGDILDSSPAEPDSTSQPNLRDGSRKFNFSSSNDKLSDSNSISAEYSFLNKHPSIQLRRKSNALHESQCTIMHVDEGMPVDFKQKDKVNIPTQEILGKRSRKPKNHAYPGEENILPIMSKVNSGRISIGNKSVQGKVSIGRKSGYKHNSDRKSTILTETKAIKSPKSTKNTSNKQSQQRKTSLVEEDNNKEIVKPSAKRSSKLAQENADNSKMTKYKSKRSSKLSQNITPRNSGNNISYNESIKEIDDHSKLRSRRGNSKVSYKESPLNVKLRRN